MKYIRAKANFFRYADEKLIVAAARIIQCMKESDIFTQPAPPLSELEDAYADYYHKVIDAKGRDREKAALKRESKRRLSDILQKMVFYVNMVSDGDLSKLYRSGFPVLAKKNTGMIPDTPTGAFVKDGQRSGEVAFGFKPVGRDMLYDYCFATKMDRRGSPRWGEIRTTTRSFTAYQDGFVPGQYIYFRVRARNKHGHSRWTDPVRWLVR